MKKIICLILCVVFLLSASGCAEASPVYASYKDREITEAMYGFWLSYYKTRFLNSFISMGYVSEDKYTEDFWDETVGGKETIKEQLASYVDGTVKQMLISAQLFDDLKLNETGAYKSAYESSVDSYINSNIDSFGSRSALNAYLSGYGMNVSDLREVYEYEAKAALVSERLFGEGGEHAVTDEEREAYYQENYHRVKHILINDISKYALDDKGSPKIDIYTGSYVTEELTDEEAEEKKKLANEVFDKARAGEDFEKLIEEYDEYGGMDVYKDGFFISVDSNYDTTYMSSAIGMSVGDVVMAETQYGIMIIKKYPLEAGMWQNTENSAFFTDSNGESVLDNNIKENKKEAFFKEYCDDIVISGAVLPDIKEIGLMDGRMNVSSGS